MLRHAHTPLIVMGPGKLSSSENTFQVTKRPKFLIGHWASSVNGWERRPVTVRCSWEILEVFYVKLPVTNSNTPPKSLQGIIMKSQLYGRASDLCKSITDDILKSDNGADAVVKEIYKVSFIWGFCNINDNSMR